MGQKLSRRREEVVFMGEMTAEPTYRTLENLGVPQYIPMIKSEDITLIKELGLGGSKNISYLAKLEVEKEEKNKSDVVFKCCRLPSNGSVNLNIPSEKMMNFEHPNLIKTLGVVLKQPRLGVVYDYVDGWNIREYLLDFGTDISTRERLKLIFEIASTMKVIEDNFPEFLQNIVLKESRIFVENLSKKRAEESDTSSKVDNKRYQIKIKHLGFDLTYDHIGSQYNKSKKFNHSKHLQPPEFTFNGETSPKSPMFQFAMISYIILTGKIHPYDNFSNDDIEIKYSENGEFECTNFKKELKKELADLPTIVAFRKIRPNFELMKEKELEWIVEMIKLCWIDECQKRPSFNDIIGEFGRNGFDVKKSIEEMDLSDRIGFLKENLEGKIVADDNMVILKLRNNVNIKFILKKYLLL